MGFGQRHPFPVVAHFERVVAISFALPEAALLPLMPSALEIDGYKGFGFVTVALVWTRKLRPAGLPEFLGQDFFLAGYRIFAKLRDESGRKLRGLRILRSETDRRSMVKLGNKMTGYRYRYVRLRLQKSGTETVLQTNLDTGTRTLSLKFDTSPGEIPLPAGSPFHDWHTARRFAGPMPFTFSARSDGSVIVVEGSRTTWQPRPIQVIEWEVSLFDEEPLRSAKPILANAFTVEKVDYRWSRGRIIRPWIPS